MTMVLNPFQPSTFNGKAHSIERAFETVPFGKFSTQEFVNAIMGPVSQRVLWGEQRRTIYKFLEGKSAPPENSLVLWESEQSFKLGHYFVPSLCSPHRLIEEIEKYCQTKKTGEKNKFDEGVLSHWDYSRRLKHINARNAYDWSGGVNAKSAVHHQLLYMEIDDTSLEQQAKTIDSLQRQGLRFSAVVMSGDAREGLCGVSDLSKVKKGKSLHIFIALSRAVSLEDMKRLTSRLAILVEGDINVVSATRKMRLGGCRVVNDEGVERIQTVLDIRHDAVCDPTELMSWLNKQIRKKGLDPEEALKALEAARLLKLRGKAIERLMGEMREKGDAPEPSTVDLMSQHYELSERLSVTKAITEDSLKHLQNLERQLSRLKAGLADYENFAYHPQKSDTHDEKCKPILTLNRSASQWNAKVLRFKDKSGLIGTASELEKKIGSLPIYVHSPWRPDNKPSALLNKTETGRWYLVDFGAGETYWALATDHGERLPGFGKSLTFDRALTMTADDARTEPFHVKGEWRYFGGDKCYSNALSLIKSIHERDVSSPVVVYLRGVQGTGKTWFARRLISSYKKMFPESRILSVNHRRALCTDQARKFGLPLYLDFNGSGKMQTGVCCLDSLWKVIVYEDELEGGEEGGEEALNHDSLSLEEIAESEPWSVPETSTRLVPVDILLLDEIEQVVRHLYNGTTIDKKDSRVIFQRLCDLIRASKIILCSDADISPVTTTLIRYALNIDVQSGAPNEILIDNTWRPDHKKIEMYDSKHAIHHQLLQTLMTKKADDKPIMVACGYKRASKEVAEMARSADRVRKKNGLPPLRILNIHSENTGDEEQSAFLNDPALVTQYDLVSYSPVLQTGFSIDAPVARVYGLLGSGLHTSHDCWQQLSRSRNPLDDTWHVWVDIRSFSRPVTPKSVFQMLLQRHKTQETIERNLGLFRHTFHDGSVQLPKTEQNHLNLFVRAIAHHNRHANNLLESIRTLAVERGCEVVQSTYKITESQEGEQKALARDAKNTVRGREVDAIIDAPRLSEDEYERLKTAPTRGSEEAAAIKAFQIRDALMLDEDAPVEERDVVMVLKNYILSKRQLAADVRTYLEEGGSKILAEFDLNAAKYGRFAKTTRTAKAHLVVSALKKSGLLSQWYVTKATLESSGFVEWADKHQAKIKATLGITYPQHWRTEPQQLLRRFVELIALKLKLKKKRGEANKWRLDWTSDEFGSVSNMLRWSESGYLFNHDNHPKQLERKEAMDQMQKNIGMHLAMYVDECARDGVHIFSSETTVHRLSVPGIQQILSRVGRERVCVDLKNVPKDIRERFEGAGISGCVELVGG